jgi:hypothetical protein
MMTGIGTPSSGAGLVKKKWLRNRERPQPFQFLARQMFRLDDLQYRLLPYVTLRSNDEELRRITVRRITENYGDTH